MNDNENWSPHTPTLDEIFKAKILETETRSGDYLVKHWSGMKCFAESDKKYEIGDRVEVIIYRVNERVCFGTILD